MNKNFPTIEDLSFEQRTAVSLNFDKNNLILGAPGTGKTIVALFRLHRLYEAGKKNIVLLVFNRPLMLYLRSLQSELGWSNEFDIYTVNDFAYYKLYSGSIEKPREGGFKNKPIPNDPASKYKIDWFQINSDFQNDKNLYDHIIVDEGQDFNKDFYKFIVNIAQCVTVFADPNQSLQDDNTSITDILKIINKEAYYVLTLNYRNSSKITEFTRRYCFDKSIFAESYIDGDDLTIKNKTPSKKAIFEEIINIVSSYDNDKNIGIIVPEVFCNEKYKFQNELYDELVKSCPNNKIQLYTNDKINEENIYRENINFNEKSVKIFNYLTVRGLDFDIVILVDSLTCGLNKFERYTDKNDIKSMNRLYVASTRSKEKLYVLPFNDSNNDEKDYINIIIDCSKYPKLDNLSIENLFDNANNYYNDKKYDLALYNLHYLFAVKGLCDDINLLKSAIAMFSNLCDRFNKSDFSLSIINNFAETHKIYDDQELIYYYQNSILDSFNWQKVYDTPVNFFRTLSKLDIKDHIEHLLDKFFMVYMQRLDGCDKNYCKEYIEKYELNNTKAYNDFIDYCDYITTEHQDEDELDKIEKTKSEYLSNLSGHELLEGSYILVIAGSHTSEDRYIEKAKKYGFEKDDFKFFLEYEKMTNHDFNIKKMSDKPKAVILGSNPHSIRNKGDFRSLNAMLSEPGYPKLFLTNQSKDFSVSAFGRTLNSIMEFLKEIYKFI